MDNSPENAFVDVNKFINILFKKNGAELFLSAGSPPSLRSHGRIQQIVSERLTPTNTQDFLKNLLTQSKYFTMDDFINKKEIKFSISIHGLGRFRVIAYHQRDAVTIIIKRVESKIPTLQALQAPKILAHLSTIRSGVIIVAGGVGSGKSTTIASLLENRNTNLTGHIVCVEDPIEFIFRNNKSMITQREIGVDSLSLENAVELTRHLSPDAFMLTEATNYYAINSLFKYSESGVACFSTLRSQNVERTLNKMYNMAPDYSGRSFYGDIASNLGAIICQKIISVNNGRARIPIFEIMVNTPEMRKVLRAGEFHKVHELMEQQSDAGMITFDKYLLSLYENEQIGESDLYNNATNPNEIESKLNNKGVTNSNRVDQIKLYR